MGEPTKFEEMIKQLKEAITAVDEKPADEETFTKSTDQLSEIVEQLQKVVALTEESPLAKAVATIDEAIDALSEAFVKLADRTEALEKGVPVQKSINGDDGSFDEESSKKEPVSKSAKNENWDTVVKGLKRNGSMVLN
jgi:exonuclease VII small subunit